MNKYYTQYDRKKAYFKKKELGEIWTKSTERKILYILGILLVVGIIIMKGLKLEVVM